MDTAFTLETTTPESPHLSSMSTHPWSDDLVPILVRQLAVIADAQGNGDNPGLFVALTRMAVQLRSVLDNGYGSNRPR